ncbi:short chain enoyl-CoA hydratase [Actinocorallia herbida]|uniref:enoyl-CoA hydratase n=1 Tax=Actinocorallia herbida TaxID=58109 RepID=A0A3N1D3B4_9ACTN|nr:crotonase/enoyl-CoA hydratase family protein [Actinocorallia herbida]ROO88024.1 short chain enoyl-CoA hydratase [Actinocorallia herbida]
MGDLKVDQVLVETTGGIMTITIERPAVRNAIDHRTAVSIGEALDELDADPNLAVAVVTGAGGTFCAGMDLKAFAGGQPLPRTERGFAGIAARPPRTPIIAAVEGYALGGGCELALACDLVVASRNAVFGLPEVKRGLTAGAGGLFRLPRRIPYHVAMELILTGQPFGAERAEHLGLVNRLTEPGGALADALALAGTIAENGPLAVAASKRVVVESQDWPQAEAFERQAPILDPVRESEDALEGAQAFAEKRRPVWRGR